MTRSRAAQQSLSVSLFPFLAVLICTMGALIVLLVVISRQASLQAAEENAQASVHDNAETQSAREIRDEIALVESDTALLEQHSRPATDAQLHDGRHRLAVTEQLIRDLRDEYERLKRDAERAAGHIDGGAARQRDLQQRLHQLQQQLAEATEQLDEARREADSKPRSYSVVPYRGPNGTRRRPIYIECRRDRVILQPEGVVLNQSDFEEPLGPGNPLAAALRATREYWADGGRVDQQGELAPYPLILVRPDGAIPYGVVRRAIKSWGPDFGYELIDQDWKLELPQADPALAAVQRQAIAEAHVDQKRLRRMAPSRFRDRDRTPFKLERTRERFSELLGTQRGGAVPGEGRGNSALPGGRTNSGVAPGHGDGLWRLDEVGPIDGERFDRGQTRGAGDGDGYGSANRQSDGRGGEHLPAGEGHGAAATEFTPGASGKGGARSGSAMPATGSPHGERSGGASTAPSVSSDAGQAVPRSLANGRGQGWALPTTAHRSTPMTRPIHVLCERDRISLLPADRRGRAKVIPLEGSTARDVDRLVEAVHQRIDTWGIAGEKFYWRPKLKLIIRPGGERRANDLKILLRDSGLEVE